MGGWIFDVVDEVRIMAMDGSIRTMARSAMNVDYRHCAELQGAIALGTVIRPLSKTDAASVARKVDAYRKKRHESQPREPSAGCIFKNPPGNSAGRLIEESGLKGTRVGGAEVSCVHANFMINRGDATGADISLNSCARSARASCGRRESTWSPRSLLYGREWKRDVLAASPVIAVFAGGTSKENEVSKGSGAACALALSRSFPTRLFDITADALPEGYDPAVHVVFSTLHGTFGEDGGMQRLLDVAGGTYAGSRRRRQCPHDGQGAPPRGPLRRKAFPPWTVWFSRPPQSRPRPTS